MTAIDAEHSYPLSPLQGGMLFHTLHAPRSGVYVQQLVGELHEELHSTAFRQAWQWVIDRHPVLRTRVGFADSGELLQRVHADAGLAVEEHDWRGTEVGEREERLRLYLDADRQRGFELGAQTPLMRLALFRMDQAEFRFVWTYHHALLDGRSRARVLTELFSAYEAFCRGEEVPLCERARPYRDYIEWLDAHDTDAEAERFWRRALRGFNAPTPLVVDTASSRSDSPDDDGFATRGVRLSKRSTAALKRLAGQHGLTLNTLVQGAWALLLNRYSGEEDIVFGATRACRTPEARPDEVWVGLFINTLPVRVRLSSEELLIPWLKRLRAQWVAAREYEHTPLVDIQAWSEVPAGTTLFESIVIFEHQTLQSALREEQEGERWAGREFRLIQATNYPLTVSAFGGPELLLDIGFDRGRFEQAMVDRMLGHLRTLLEGMATHPEARLSELPLLSEAERHQVLVEWNDTQADYPKDRCVHELFEEQAERTPDAVAVALENHQLTYDELNKQANQLAHHLRNLGVGPEILVGICMERSLAMVVGLLGILKAGGAYVPLDPAYPKERLTWMLQDAQVPVLLTQERLAEGLPEHGAEAVCLDSSLEEIAKESDENPTSGAGTGNLAYVIYTSGSTGRPKGVCVPHKSAVEHFFGIIRQEFGLMSTDRVLQFAPLSYDASLEQIFPTLSSGATLVLRGDTVWSTAEFLRKTAEFRVTVANLPTPYWHQLVQDCATAGATPSPHDSFRLISVGGEAMPPESVRLWQQTLFRSVRLLNAYGPTEATVTSTHFEIMPSLSEIQQLATVPIGRPIAGRTVYLLDERIQPVPIGVPGKLYIGGAGLASGYLNRPGLTAERFVPDPFSGEPGARLYSTGDLARYLPDGNIEFLGRIDYQVKVRGFRIELGEVETVLSQHPAVREAVVVAQEDMPGSKRLVAYVVPTEQQEQPTTSELRAFMKAKVPEYMVPMSFVALEALPLTPAGKVDRRALPVPEGGLRPEQEGDFVAPRDELEERLARIWAEVLGIPLVGIHDDFFELGGHSLLATQVVSRLREALQVELSLRNLFMSPTVALLAQRVVMAHQSTASSSIAKTSLGNLDEGRL